MAEDNELFWPSLYGRLVPHVYDRGFGDEDGLGPQHFLTDFETLRHHIQTDLRTLLNATCLEATLMAGEDPPVREQGDHVVLEHDRMPLSGFPLMRRSIINFGLPSMIGRAVYRLRIQDLEQELKESILAFEPRLKPETLRVQVTLDEGQSMIDPHEPVGFNIEAEVRGTSATLQVQINTIWDLEKLSSGARLTR